MSLIIVFIISGAIGLYVFDMPSDFVYPFLHFFGLVLFILSLPAHIILIANQKGSLSDYTPHILIIVLAVMGIISTLFSTDIQLSIIGGRIRHEGLLSLLSYYAIFMAASLLSKKQQQKVLLLFIVSGVIHGLYALLQHFPLFSSWIYSRNDYGNSIGGFIGNPNFFGSYIVLLSAISMTLVCFTKQKTTIVIALITSLFFILLSIYSNTTSSWIGITFSYILIGLFIIIAKHQGKQKNLSRMGSWVQWFILGMSGLFLFVFINWTEDMRYLNAFGIIASDAVEAAKTGKLTDSMGSSRGFIWNKCIELLPDYWLHGCGVDAMITLDIHIPSSRSIVDKAHNEFIQTALTQGIFAFIIYTVFLFTVARKGFSNFILLLHEKHMPLTLALLISFSGYVVQSVFNISVITVAPYFWMISGFICSLSNHECVERIQLSTSNQKNYVGGENHST